MILIVILAVLASVVNKIYTKIYIKNTDAFTMLLVTNIMLSLLTLPIVFLNFSKIFQISGYGWVVIIFTCTLWSLNGFLGNYTYKIASLSIREPFSQIQIIFAVLIGLTFFEESPNMFDYLGVAIIIFAGIILALGKNVNKDEVNLKTISTVCLMAFVASITTAFDKYTLNFTDPQIYLFFNFFISSLVLLLVMNSQKKNSFLEIMKDKARLREMFLLSVFFGVSFYLSLLAYKSLDLSIVFPILKISAPLTAVFGIMFLGERQNWKIKIFSVLLAVAGVIIIKLF